MNPPVTNDCESFTFGVLCLKSFPKDDKKIEQLQYCKNNVANIYKISFCFLNWKRKFSACTYLQVEHNMIMIKRLGPDYLRSMTYLYTQLCKTHIHNNTRKIYNSVQPISSIMT